MTRLITIAAAVFALTPLAMGDTTPRTVMPESVYAKFDYMHLADSTPMQYFELELGEWRPVQAQRIRRGVTNAWYFFERMPGARPDGDQPYDYITVSIFPAYENVFDEAGVEAIFDVYPGIELQEMYDRADEARDFARSDLWKVAAVVSREEDGQPAGEYLLLTFFDGAAPGEGETQAWAAAAAAGVENGGLNSAALLVLANPDDEARPYALVTIQYADALPALLEVDAHGGLESSRTAYKSQIWRFIDAIHEADLEAE